MSKLSCKIIDFDSDEYKATLFLRNKILRIPLGMILSEEELIPDKGDFHFGCFSNNQLIACLIMSSKKDGTVKMRQVAVDDTFQSKGIGRFLVQYSELWAVQQGFDLVWCHARLEAVPFYERLDYTKDGSQFEEVGIAHYRMTKRLS